MSTYALKPYSAYKPSGSEWLGEIPVEWVAARFKTIFVERSEKGFADEPLLAATQTKGVVRKEKYENRTVLALKDLDNLKLVKTNDFVISLRSFQGGIEYARDRGIISPAYTVFFPQAPDVHGYYSRLFKSLPYIENLKLNVTGIRQGQNVDFMKLRRTYVPVPPKSDQDAIVRYLNYVNSRITRLIKKKRNLITLVNEQKQAIIYQAVTKGLNPNVQVKPSGIEWLGDIPEHWEIRPNRSLMRLRKQIVGTEHSGYVLLSLTIKGVVPRDMENPEGKFPASFESYQRAADGDLIFCLFDIDETPRTVGIADQTGMVTGAYDVYTCGNPDITSFIYYYYLAMDNQKRLRPFYTGLRKVIRETTFRGIKIAIPPKAERDIIVSTLDKLVQDIDHAISKLKQEINLISEYRARVNSDVVTGRIDVREAAQNLPSVCEADDIVVEEGLEDLEPNIEDKNLDVDNLELEV